jgi:hypothetical protein
MIQRTGAVVIRMMADVTQATIGPLIERTITQRTVVYADEYDIRPGILRVRAERPGSWQEAVECLARPSVGTTL